MNSALRILAVIMFLFASSTYFHSASADNKLKDYGEFKNKWCAGECREIGYINKNTDFTITYEIDQDCKIPGGTEKKFKDMVNESALSWCKPLGLMFNIQNKPLDDYTIKIKVISRENFKQTYLSDPANRENSIDEDAIIGIVNRDKFKNVGTARLENVREETDISVYEIDEATIYIVWDDELNSNYRTGEFGYLEWKILLTHELGHALGYRGHNIDSKKKNIMYKNGTELIKGKIDVPAREEIGHLKNIYDIVH